MYLKRIEVKGFKSFADRAVLDFGKGITAVVGPNGSGKSNLADAVRWVLGEQSAKSLRGAKMEDIIFSGTDIRKPLGFAEVSITLDNSDNMLPMDFSEITVTRRMFRSGESEYYINGTSCRLKDITELFMDTGIGRDGYSIIGQGRVDEIINAKPEDRREVFEEAAGIVKYRTRKQEAERRLESTEQNIIRLEDIISELNTQIGPLKEQSEKAKTYLNLKERYKVLDLNIFIRNMEKQKEKQTAAAENLASLEDELLDNNRKSAMLEENCSRMKLNVSENDKSIEELKQEVHANSNEVEKLQGEINVCSEKISNLDANSVRLDNEIGLEKSRIDEYKISIESCNKNLSENGEIINSEKSKLEAKETEFEKVNNGLSDKEKYLESMKSEVIEILNDISDKKSSLNGLSAFSNNIEKRKSQILIEKEEKLNKKEELNQNLQTLNNDLSGIKEQYSICAKNAAEYKNSMNELSNNKKLLEKEIFELNGKLQSRKARHKILCEMESEFEGYNRSVKEIMKLKGGSPLIGSGKFADGICGVVADLVKTDKKYETAIEVALGASLQNIVTVDEYVAQKCIDFLKERKYGRATFLPLSTIRKRNAIQNEQKIKSSKGFQGFANDLVTFENRYKNIFSNLLGRVIVIDNMDNAIVLAKNIGYSTKIVTLDGDVVNPGGSFTGGSIGHRTSSILGRKREIEELNKDLVELSNTLSLMNDKLSDTDKKLERLAEGVKDSDNNLHVLEKNISNCENSISNISSDLARIESEIEGIIRESDELDQEEAEINTKMKNENAALSELNLQNEHMSFNIQKEQSDIKEIVDAREKLLPEITDLKIKLAELNKTVETLLGRNDEITSNIKKCEAVIDDKNIEKEKSLCEKKKVEAGILKLKSRIENILKINEASSKKLEVLYQEKKKDLDCVEEMQKKIKEYGESTALLQSELNKCEISKAKLDMEIENLQNRIWEDYELNFASAQKYKTEIESITQVNKDIAVIKQQIKELGDVNVSSIDEYKKVKERYDFLTVQESDLKEAKESLEKVISEMTEKMKSQFVKNFAVINENFNMTFHKLFGGGRAELVLVDKDDVLESGVDIVAEPPGKKLQNLTLLSGGEKALTAIALLFAILKMKPSPFCILDEIEAALDDINVVRFANFLRELSKNTEFIVVTHRKGTMEAADALYGVTMEEKGVSKLVSVKLVERAS